MPELFVSIHAGPFRPCSPILPSCSMAPQRNSKTGSLESFRDEDFNPDESGQRSNRASEQIKRGAPSVNHDLLGHYRKHLHSAFFHKHPVESLEGGDMTFGNEIPEYLFSQRSG